MRICIIAGTRPEWLKLISTIKALVDEKIHEIRIINTGQHTTLADDVLKFIRFRLGIDTYDLNNMGQPLPKMLSRMIEELHTIIDLEKPELLIVQGDTLTTLAGALTGYYSKIPVMHIESGSRSFDLMEPYPEEMDRILTDRLSTYRFCMCNSHRENLIKEGMDGITIGNTGIDALSVFGIVDKKKEKQIVITAHRRENWEKLIDICKGIFMLAHAYKDWTFKFVMHANPRLQEIVKNELSNIDNVKLLQPMNYLEFMDEVSKSYLLLTDSGGASQEAPSLKTPVLMLRNVCENPKLIECNLAKVIGTDTMAIYEETDTLLQDIIRNETFKYENSLYYNMIGTNPYGDGNSYKPIIEFINNLEGDEE